MDKKKARKVKQQKDINQFRHASVNIRKLKVKKKKQGKSVNKNIYSYLAKNS